MTNFEVELPAGGIMRLQSAEEVDLWEKSHERYLEDYQLSKNNDLVLVGALLQAQVTLYRAQCALNGMEPELDNAGVPTGRYIQRTLDANETDKYNKILNTAANEMMKYERALGIDKVSRESGGAMSVENYLRTLKKAAHERAIHVTDRTLAYEAFANDLRTRLRILRNADAEDRNHHGISPDKIITWADDELRHLEQVDIDFAQQRGKIYVGQL